MWSRSWAGSHIGHFAHGLGASMLGVGGGEGEETSTTGGCLRDVTMTFKVGRWLAAYRRPNVFPQRSHPQANGFSFV